MAIGPGLRLATANFSEQLPCQSEYQVVDPQGASKRRRKMHVLTRLT